MNVRGLHVEDALVGSRERFAAGLLHDHRHGIGFVHQPQLAVRGFLRGRIHEHAALEENAMDVRHHRADVAAGIVVLLRPIEILLIALRERAPVAFVH